MTYAGQLIEKAKLATGESDRGLGERLGVSGPVISQWRHGKGSPMPQERVLELCDLAGITDEATRGYWLHGVERDAVTITSVRRALDAALDRLRPTVAAVGLIVVASALLGLDNGTALLSNTFAVPEALGWYIMRILVLTLIAAAAWWLARTEQAHARTA